MATQENSRYAEKIKDKSTALFGKKYSPFIFILIIYTIFVYIKYFLVQI